MLFGGFKMILVQKTFKNHLFTDIRVGMLTVESDLSAINPKDCYKLDLTVCIDNKDYNFRTALCKVAELKNGSGVDFKSYYWDGTKWASKKEVIAVATEQFTKIINLQKSEA